MSISTIDADVRAYVDAVASHLHDLPEQERRDLVDDLHQHLLEVAAEDGGSLEERLGSPHEYARELRASAELPPGDATLPRRAAIASAARSLLESRAVLAVRERIPEAGPGWWLLRGYAAVSMAAIIANHGYTPEFIGRASFVDVVAPWAFDSRLAGVGAAVLAAWLSYRLGRYGAAHRAARRVSVLASAGVVVATLLALTATKGVSVYLNEDGHATEYLHHADGVPIGNICPYGSDGALLSGVLLFDQDGRPVRNVTGVDVEGQGSAAIENAYPKPMRALDPDTGEIRDVSCPTLRIGGTAAR